MSLTSRIAKKEIPVPSGVTVKLDGQILAVSGKHGEQRIDVHHEVVVKQEENALFITPKEKTNNPVTAKKMSGTIRALIANAVEGVANRFEKKLELRGVGYRAAIKGKVISLSLGKSHTDDYSIPEGIEIEVIKNTTLIVKGVDKQKVGQVSAEIRQFRPPEHYKGKGIRYHDEVVKLKETKKK